MTVFAVLAHFLSLCLGGCLRYSLNICTIKQSCARMHRVTWLQVAPATDSRGFAGNLDM